MVREAAVSLDRQQPSNKARSKGSPTSRSLPGGLRIAVLLPCLNEAASIARVVEAFQTSLPGALVYVYDNDSDDGTAEIARRAGAVVHVETMRGKGNVVRRMFADIDADIFVLSDGDMTYDASKAPQLIEQLLEEELDMLVATRAPTEKAHRTGHALGNRLFNHLARLLFGGHFTDVFSGYRVFTRRFVKSFPAVSRGFEIESELTVHALDLRVKVAEVALPYRARGADSESKLRTFRDGFKLLLTFLLLCKEVRPFAFFTVLSGFFAADSIILAYPIMATWLETGLVPRLPTAVLCATLMIFAFMSLASGMVLDSVGKARHEMKRLHYLALGPLLPNGEPD